MKCISFSNVDGKLGNTGIAIPSYSQASDWSINCETGNIVYSPTFANNNKNYYTTTEYIESGLTPKLDNNGLASETFSIVRGIYVLTVPKGYGVANIDSATGAVSSLKTVEQINAITFNDINSGIVIVDDISNANEFVWIPIPNVNVMYENVPSENNRKVGKLYNFDVTTKTYSPIAYATDGIREPDVLRDTEYGDASSTNLSIIENSVLESWATGDTVLEKWENQLQTEFDNMIEKVGKYKGFYIGRYESSLETNVLCSKKNKSADMSMTYYDAYNYAKNLKLNDEDVYTSILWGSQWAQVLLWYNSCGIDIYNSVYGNSSDVDVYNDSGENIIKSSGTRERLNTGITTFTMRNNIFDLAGNHGEVTQAVYLGFMRLAPGGYWYGKMSKMYLAADYYINMMNGDRTITSMVSPRLQLYIK